MLARSSGSHPVPRSPLTSLGGDLSGWRGAQLRSASSLDLRRPIHTRSLSSRTMATSDDLFSLVQPNQACNIGRAATRLMITVDEAQALGDVLVQESLCVWVGRNRRRIRRTATSDPPGMREPPALGALDQLARDLWHALPSDGEQVTNVEIRSRNEFAEVDGRDLQQARRLLKRAGLVELRAGRDGGGLRRVPQVSGDSTPADAPTVEQLEPLERDLYEPFRDWLHQEIDEDTFSFAQVVVTANARRQGKWSQPDVCQLTVSNFPNLPGATVELSSYEIKRRADAGKLEAVYEAAAHGRWAHRANLVLEVEGRDSKIAPEILKDAARFGLGVYKLWLSDGRASVQQLITSGIQQPEDSDLDDMVKVVLDRLPPRHQNRYTQSLR